MKFDMHTHTKYSRCSLMEPGRNIKAALKKGLSGIAVTDHNSIKGALKTARLAKKHKGFEVVVGEEVMTDFGEVLAYNINAYIQPGPIVDVIDKIRQQGGIACVAHPYSSGIIRKSVGDSADEKELKKALEKVHAIETFNARTTMSANSQAIRLAKELGVGCVGGSDAHFCWEIGRGYTVSRNADSVKGLIRDILKKKTAVRGNNNLFWAGRLLSFPVRLLR